MSGSHNKNMPFLHPIPMKHPFQIIGVDAMDLSKPIKGIKHVIVFQDLFTKWPLIFSVPDQKIERIVRLLCEEMVPMFGAPEALISDRGTNHLSHLMLDVCKSLGVM